jgi:uncharacterized protein (TIGR00730 family)
VRRVIAYMGRREFRLIIRALRDLVRGFRALQRAGPCVTVFGSARCSSSHPYYNVGREIGRRLTQLGFTVMTGGGPGLMEAVNRGAQDAGGRSVGCNIRLPSEQSPNRYLDRWAECEQFFIRKVLLCRYSYAFIALPGGFGTMDELFEVLTLIQTEKIERFPVVLIGSAYWQPVVAFLQQMVAEGMADRHDLTLAMVTDDLDEAMQYIRRCAAERFGLRLQPAPAQPNDGKLRPETSAAARLT